MMKRIRQYIGILAALVVYYVIHEGAHLVVAMIQGVFKEVKFMGLGIQIDVFRDCMTDTQLGLFCLAWYVLFHYLPMYGDMNGIRLLMPEVAARIIFAVVGVIHFMVIWKYLLPKYKESFNS